MNTLIRIKYPSPILCSIISIEKLESLNKHVPAGSQDSVLVFCTVLYKQYMPDSLGSRRDCIFSDHSTPCPARLDPSAFCLISFCKSAAFNTTLKNTEVNR